MADTVPSDPNDPHSDAVVKLPRGKGIRLSRPELVRIVMTAGLLVALIALTKPCSKSVSTFVTGFGSGSAKGSGSGSGAGSAKVDPYEHLTPNMSDDEVRAAIERSKIKNANGQGPVPIGSGSGGSAGSGSAGSAVAPVPVQMQRRELTAPRPASP